MKKPILMFVALLALSNNALAVTATFTLNVGTSVPPTCRMNADNISFGSIPTGSLVSIQSAVAIHCTKTTSYNISLSPGNSGNDNSRSMKGFKAANTDLLKYNVYVDSNYQNVLPYGTNSTGSISGNSDGKEINFSLYSKIDAGQYITPDNYSDNLIITVQY